MVSEIRSLGVKAVMMVIINLSILCCNVHKDSCEHEEEENMEMLKCSGHSAKNFDGSIVEMIDLHESSVRDLLNLLGEQ